jgi:hypothetical protein
VSAQGNDSELSGEAKVDENGSVTKQHGDPLLSTRHGEPEEGSRQGESPPAVSHDDTVG